MKTAGKITIWIGILIVVVFVAYKARKVLHAMRMKFGLGGMNLNPKKLDKAQWVSSLLTSQGLDANVGIKISNPSPSTFNITQISADVYTKNGTLLASQDKPLQSPFEVKPNINNILNINYFVPISGLYNLLDLEGLSILNKGYALYDIAKSYFATGKLGKTIVLDGFAVAEGIKVNITKQEVSI